MRLLPSAYFLLLSLSSLPGQGSGLTLDNPAFDEEEERENNQNVLSRVPIGAVATNIQFPKYDETHRLTSVVTAAEMTADSSSYFSGKNLKLEIYDDGKNIETTATMARAEYLFEEERLIGNGQILIRARHDEFVALGTGGIFEITESRAIIFGPTQTKFTLPSSSQTKSTSTMISKPLLAAAAASQLATASPNREPSAEELVEFERAAAPRITPEDESPQLLSKADTITSTTSQRMQDFLFGVGREDLLIQNPTAPKKDLIAELFQPNPDRVVITSSRGIYFDATNREVVYLGDIRLRGQGITLTCDQDLKVIFENQDPAAKSEKTGKAKTDGLGGMNDVKLVTAAGNLRVSGEKDGKTFILGGDRAVFDQKAGKLTIRGDRMAFKLGDNGGARSTDPDASAVITIKENTITAIDLSKNWETVITVPSKKN